MFRKRDLIFWGQGLAGKHQHVMCKKFSAKGCQRLRGNVPNIDVFDNCPQWGRHFSDQHRASRTFNSF